MQYNVEHTISDVGYLEYTTLMVLNQILYRIELIALVNVEHEMTSCTFFQNVVMPNERFHARKATTDGENGLILTGQTKTKYCNSYVTFYCSGTIRE